MGTWINFKELREKLDFEQVLRHYKVEVKRKGAQHHGFCPLPNHNGKRNSPSFSANLPKGIFQCFGCGAKGNVLEFAALMENVSPQDGPALRNVALKLQERFSTAPPSQAKPQPNERVKKTETKGRIVAVNVPLDFELKDLDPEHSYLRGRDLTRETIDRFGLGFCARGYLKDRVAIPLHDSMGRLVGYAGRVVDDDAVNEENPRYRFPGSRERDGSVFEFRKILFLYNGFRIQAPVDDLVVVEGFPSIWWLHQNGIRNTVSTMGNSLSDEQADIIVKKTSERGIVWIFSDGDDAGKRFEADVFTKVAPYRSIRLVRSPEGKQPTDYSPEELQKIFGAKPDSARQSTSSIKARLDKKEIGVRQAIIELARYMPALDSLNLTPETWDAEKVDALAERLSSGERICVQFILHVWDFRRSWKVGAPDMGALDTLDKTHRRIFSAWAADPWWC
jgi:DNA primase